MSPRSATDGPVGEVRRGARARRRDREEDRAVESEPERVHPRSDRGLERAQLKRASAEAEAADHEIRDGEARRRARAVHTPLPGGGTRITVRELDMYQPDGRSFFADLYAGQVQGDLQARSRIETHQTFELEKRAVTSATLGGIIQPAYLGELYAKASRNGRVFADQCNGQRLPEVGSH